MVPIKFDKFDNYLETNGFMRRHMPKDETCLFRAIAECVYKTQTKHSLIRMKCAKYLSENPDLIGIDNYNIDGYLNHLICGDSFGGFPEVNAITEIYKRKIIVYTHTNYGVNYEIFGSLFESTSNDHQIIRLVFTRPFQFDLIYSLEYFKKLAITQSIVYELMYLILFEYGEKELNDSLNLMLTEKVFVRIKRDMKRKVNSNAMHENGFDFTETEKFGKNLSQRLPNGQITSPFPYKIAKALHPNMFRNVPFDVWIEHHKKIMKKLNKTSIVPGLKCKVYFTHKDLKTTFNCQVLQVYDQLKEVTAFVDHFGIIEKISFECLEIFHAKNRYERKKVQWNRRSQSYYKSFRQSHAAFDRMSQSNEWNDVYFYQSSYSGISNYYYYY